MSAAPCWPTSASPPEIARGVALLARCAGLLGHIAEEMADPIGMDIYMNIDRNTDYRPPQDGTNLSA